MKKFYFSLLIVAGVFASIIAFHACSTDESDEHPQSKAQLLMKKSQEFAKKYDVNMVINKDSIESLAQTLTIEQMEKDYQEMAGFHETFFVPNSYDGAKTINKLRIRRKALNFETTDITGTFDCHDEGAYKNINVNVAYRIGNGQGNNSVRVTLNRYGEIGSSTFVPQGVTKIGDKDCEFSASGTVSISGTYIISYHVFIEHSRSGNRCVISVDTPLSTPKNIITKNADTIAIHK